MHCGVRLSYVYNQHSLRNGSLVTSKVLHLRLSRLQGFHSAFVLSYTKSRRYTRAEDDALTKLVGEKRPWKSIAAELDIPEKSLVNHWHKTLQPRLPEAGRVRRPQLTKQEKATILDQIGKGRSIRDIAKDLGRQPRTIKKYLSKPRDDGQEPSIDWAQTLKLVEEFRSQGKQVREIAAQFGMEPLSFAQKLRYHTRKSSAERQAARLCAVRELRGTHTSVPDIAAQTNMAIADVHECIRRLEMDYTQTNIEITKCWSEEEYKTLCELHKAGTSNAEIAELLGRSSSSIRNALRRAHDKGRISFRPRVKARPFSNAEFLSIVHLRQDKRQTWTHIASQSNRRQSVVQAAYQRWQQDGTLSEYLKAKSQEIELETETART